jgi:hypothetical protein
MSEIHKFMILQSGIFSKKIKMNTLSKKLLIVFFVVITVSVSCTKTLVNSTEKPFFKEKDLVKTEIDFLSANDLRLMYDLDFQSKGLLQLVDISNGCLKLFDIQSREFQKECFDSLLIDGNFIDGKYFDSGWIYSNGFEDDVDLVVFHENTKETEVLSQNFLFSDYKNGLVLGSKLDPVNYFGDILLYDLGKKTETTIDLQANSLRFAQSVDEIVFAKYDETNDWTELGTFELSTNETKHLLKIENQALSVLWGISDNKVFLSDENRSGIFIWEKEKGKITKAYNGLVLNPIVLENRNSVAFTTIENGKSFLVILPFD